jgi:hypothetical protein
MHRACCYAAFAALTFLAAGPAAAQKRSLVVANATADAGELDPHLRHRRERQDRVRLPGGAGDPAPVEAHPLQQRRPTVIDRR